jgi:hypothetical protein
MRVKSQESRVEKYRARVISKEGPVIIGNY